MLILLPLLRRLSVRSRITVGLILTVAGSALTATAATAAPSLLVQSIVALLVGVVFLVSAWTTARRRPLGAS
jgi:hypothetical protein